MHHLRRYSRLTPLILLLMLSVHCFAQQEPKPGSFGLHAGINSAILDNALGPSLSFHYAPNTGRILQPEAMLFFDAHSGSAFISGAQTKSSAIGLAAGLRINISPHTKWNPSLVVMLGIAYGSETSNQGAYRNSGLSGAFSFGISNSFRKKHMVSLGLNTVGDTFMAAHLQYGIWL